MDLLSFPAMQVYLTTYLIVELLIRNLFQHLHLEFYSSESTNANDVLGNLKILNHIGKLPVGGFGPLIGCIGRNLDIKVLWVASLEPHLVNLCLRL